MVLNRLNFQEMFQHVGIQFIFFYVKYYNIKIHYVVFFSQHVQNITLYPSQWDICEKNLDILRVFNDATLVF